jgi:hypothetical protein
VRSLVDRLRRRYWAVKWWGQAWRYWQGPKPVIAGRTWIEAGWMCYRVGDRIDEVE